MSDQDIINQAISILEARLHKPEIIITQPSNATDYLKLKFNGLEYESFRVMFLNNQHGLIKFKEMFRGTVHSASIHPREVVKAALHFNAAATILTHNHPSGCSEPSSSDKRITEALIAALKLVDVRVLDHIIVGGDETFSFAEHGMI